MKSIRKLFSVLTLFITALFFQNCAEDLDLSQVEVSDLSSQNSQKIELTAEGELTELSEVTLNVEVGNLSNYSIEWYKNGVKIEGLTEESLVFSEVTMADAGEYKIQLRTESEIFSAKVNIVINENPDYKLIQDTYFTYGNQKYYLYVLESFTPAQQQSLANDFCKSKVSSGSIAESYTVSEELTSFSFMASNDVSFNECLYEDYYGFDEFRDYRINNREFGEFGGIGDGYVDNFCLIPLLSSYKAKKITKIICQR